MESRGHAPSFPEYAADEARLDPAPVLSTPTLVLHGQDDLCNNPELSAGKEHYFSGPYQRVLIAGAGHFPQREKAAEVLQEIRAFCL